MSSYKRLTRHPITKEWKYALWLDDYFGQHNYGVIFDGNELFKADDYEWETKDEEDVSSMLIQINEGFFEASEEKQLEVLNNLQEFINIQRTILTK